MAAFLTRHRNALLHVAFWLMYASFFFYSVSFGRRGEVEWARVVPDVAFHLGGLIGISYLNYFVFLPRLLRNQDLGGYLLRFLPVFTALSYLFLLGKRAILRPFVGDGSWMNSPRFALSVILSALFISLFVGMLRFVEDYFAREAQRRERENVQLSSELRFLRAQVNPHFLFNTLNNLYAMVVARADGAADVVAKLSGMMRYLLHESNHETVALEREVAYLENYLELEKLRLNDAVPIAFEVEGPTAGVQIAPLLLITFVENAFKHGISNREQSDSWITIRLTVSEGRLDFWVRNSRVADRDKTVTETGGIGLANARRRLELSYPGRHELTTEQTADTYAVHLQIAPL